MEEYRVALKEVADLRGLGLRERVTGPAGIGELMSDGFAALRRVGAVAGGAPVAVYHDEQFSRESIDVEMVFPVPAWLKGPLLTPGGRTMERRTVPGGEVVAVVHVGPYESIGRSYQILADWMGEYGYRANGPPRELYLRVPTDGAGVPVTEIRVPAQPGG